MRLGLIFSTAAVALAIASPAEARDRYDRRIVVMNQSNDTIVEVHITNVGRDDWGRDLLGNNVVPPGYEITVNPEDNSGYCKYDLLAVNEYGQTTFYEDANICTATQWVIWDFD